MGNSNPPTAFEISDAYVESLIRHSPEFATALGVPGSDHLWRDYSTTGTEQHHQIVRAAHRDLQPHLEDPDLDQRTAARVLTGALEHQIEGFRAGDHYLDLGHLVSSFRGLRTIFDTMDQSSQSGWENIAGRLEGLDRVFASYAGRLEDGRILGQVVAQRQVVSVVKQARALSGNESAYGGLLAKAGQRGFSSGRLERAVEIAQGAADGFADYLETTYLPSATEEDAVGRERYLRAAAGFLGMSLDPVEAYEWGWDEIARLLDAMQNVGAGILPGGDLDTVTNALENHQELMATSHEAFCDFILSRLVDVIDELDGRHFDIPAAIRDITVNIAPPGGALGAYYIRPSEDFSRPGSVWYSVGDQKSFPLYHQVSTAYHEGFPGHHLQIGTAMANTDRLSRAHRLTVFYPGYTEGWAMYTERLMGELGFLERPEFFFGMLAKQMYRAVRVVVDIGLHLGYKIPDTAPMGTGAAWNYDIAVEYMRRLGFRTQAQAHDEVLRYLGWPGQAISYKLGEREILSIREQAKRDLGSRFDLKAFHREVVGNGTMGLAMLRAEVSERL